MPVNHKILPIRRTPNRRRRLALGSKRQQRFLLAIRLLIKSLQASNRAVDLLLADQVKFSVRECIRQNRAGDKTTIPLQPMLETRLRGIVGNQMFAESLFLVDFYHAKQLVRH